MTIKDYQISRWNYYKKERYIQCLELNISEGCNYKCEYCIFHRNNKKVTLMDPSKAAKISLQYDSYLNGRPGKIYLGSGEPLLNWDAIVHICEALHKTKSSVELYLMSNASLLNQEKLMFLHNNNIHTGFSLDGNKRTQNLSRKPIDSSIDSYEVIMRTLDWANQINYPIYSLSATYNKPNFLSEAQYVMSICEKYKIQEFDLDYDIQSLRQEELEQVASELTKCFFLAKSKGLKTFGYWLIPYFNGNNPNQYHSYCDNSLGISLCISADGRIKVCGYDSTTYQNFCSFEMAYSNPKLEEAFEKYNLRNDECLNCDLYPLCLGQCFFHDPNDIAFRNNCTFLKMVTSKMLEYNSKHS